MEVNVGNTDRMVRIVVGALLIVIALLSFMDSPAVLAILIIIGAVLLFTGWTRHCSLYKVFKFSTVEKK